MRLSLPAKNFIATFKNYHTMYRQKEKHEHERPLGCWQVLGIVLVVFMVFLFIYEPIANLLR